MPLHDEIQRAIGAHGLWKTRLRNAVQNGRAEVVSSVVQVDNACDFGKWLYSLPVTIQANPSFQKARAQHAQFHREAAGVLRLVESGRMADAQAAIEPGSAFERATVQLVATLVEWSKAA